MIYGNLAPFYDKFNKDIDYSAWADFIERLIAQNYTEGKPELVLDLACGTGSMTLELASRGYDMTGVDYSPEMLDEARSRAEKRGLDVLWLCQDMREFELYGTVDVTVCCLDSINHLTSSRDLGKCLSLVHNYLIPNGLFIFDINGRYKFENVYSDLTYACEDGGAVCIWQNYYNNNNGMCDFYITLFSECEDGRYERSDEVQREKMYTVKQMRAYIAEAGFELCGIFGGFDFSEPEDDCERWYVVARAKK